MSLSQNVACKRLSTLGLNQSLIHSVLNTISKWKRCEGTENTIKRLKQLKVAYVRRLAGMPVDLSWIAHKNGIPKGPFGSIFRMKNPQKALSALMVYSSEVATSVTPKQSAKFFNSVNPEVRGNPLNKKWSHYAFCSLETVEPSNMYTFPLTGRVPMIGGVGTVLEPTHSVIRDVTRLPFVNEIEDLVLDSLRYIEKEFTQGELIPPQPGDETLPVGRIGFIQEPGYKLRAVANPNRGLQYLLDPLKRSLLRKLSTSVNDCTIDQSKGWLWAQGMIAQHLRVESVDLSDATNLFPLDIQVHLLRQSYGLDDDYHMLSLVDLFEKSSRGSWVVPGGSRCVWTVGQPLGLGPSFPSFALAHHYIMYTVVLHVDKINPKDVSFDKFLMEEQGYKILGDDIVMLDKYGLSYRLMMNNIGCKISEDKCLNSDTAAEFASRIILGDRILLQNKWKLSSDRNFVDLLYNLGPKAISHLRPRQREVAYKIAYLPVEKGGLGWNPKGYPLRARELAADIIISSCEDLDLHRLDVQASFNRTRDRALPDSGTPAMSKGWRDIIENEILNDLSPQSPTRTLIEHIDKSNGIHTKTIYKTEDAPLGFTPMDVISDPRGVTQLESYENRIKGANMQNMVDLSRDATENLQILEDIDVHKSDIVKILEDISQSLASDLKSKKDKRQPVFPEASESEDFWTSIDHDIDSSIRSLALQELREEQSKNKIRDKLQS